MCNNNYIKKYCMQGSGQFTSQIKSLSKKFGFYDKANIKLMFEFCEFDLRRTYKVLTIAEQLPIPLHLIKTLIDKPETSDHVLDQMVHEYDKKYGMDKEQLNDHEEVDYLEKKVQEKPQFDLFEGVPMDVVAEIMKFLDPASFQTFSYVNSKFFRLRESDIFKDYFKNLCVVLLHTDIPVLPQPTRFLEVRDYVLSHPIEFGPNSRNAVNNNLTYYVWKSQPLSFRLQKQYYISFGSYKNLFTQCARPHFNGYYLCKHKYIKIGEKNHTNSYAPIHVIFYYRYLRFLNDGSVIYHVVPKKLKEQQIGEKLSINELEKEPKGRQVMIGEYMQYKNKLFVKTIKSNSIFSFEFEISSSGGIFNKLSVLHYTLEMIDESEILQTLYQAKPHRQPLTFEYIRNKDIQLENPPRIQACSL